MLKNGSKSSDYFSIMSQNIEKNVVKAKTFTNFALN